MSAEGASLAGTTRPPAGGEVAGGVERRDAAALSEGTLLNGRRLVVERVLGRGGVGITYLGRVRHPVEQVAIKEFCPSGAVREGLRVLPPADWPAGHFQAARERFLNVWRSIGFLDHAGILRIRGSFAEHDTAYVVMEWLRGRTLAEQVNEGGPLPEAEALACVRPIGAALHTIHQAGFLHLDVKPEHLMACADGRVVLLDCDTAREIAGGRAAGVPPLVTPGYAPLEQYARDGAVGVYTDVYALAATLYDLLTGRAPVPAHERARGLELIPLRQLNPRVSLDTADAVMRALEMRIERRPRTVRDFLFHLPIQPGRNGNQPGGTGS